MSILVFITKPEEAETLVLLGLRLAQARDATLSVVCWEFSAAVEFPLLADREVLHDVEKSVNKVQIVLDSYADPAAPESRYRPDQVSIRSVLSPDPVVEAIGQARQHGVQLLVAAAGDRSGTTGASYATSPLLRQSPCNTLAVYVDPSRSQNVDRILIATMESVHDRIGVSLAARLSRASSSELSIATIEDDTGEEAFEVGHRTLKQIMREASVEPDVSIKQRVFLTDETFQDIALEAEQNDLVLISVNHQDTVQKLIALTTKPTVAVIKRAPPLKQWWGERAPDWIPQLNPADYADLVHGLRRGSEFGTDFMVMLGLAAAIASLGLSQDSPAVVIGSMLLAPLMTPMIGSGLALAQANARLAKTCFRSIFSGFLLTLAISFTVGVLTPGTELTQQIISRGNPNLLDLFVALFSAMAASYALARPGLLGAVAGVAIATALVPPLCSVGIALAYGEHLIAVGAAMLFTTNVVAIILAAAVTFRMMGITMARAAPRARRWVYQVVAMLGVTTILLAIPLANELKRQIDLGRPQPLAYPLPKSVMTVLLEKLDNDEGVELILAGRSSILEDDIDVSIWLTSKDPIRSDYIQELTALIHREMSDAELVVDVRCIQEAWASEDDQKK